MKNWCNFKFQTNYCVNLLRKTKKEHHENLSFKNAKVNKTFCKTVKAYFSNKESNDKVIAKAMSIFFINVTKKSTSKPWKVSSLTDINKITSNFDNNISIKKIKESFANIVSLNFNVQEISF